MELVLYSLRTHKKSTAKRKLMAFSKASPPKKIRLLIFRKHLLTPFFLSFFPSFCNVGIKTQKTQTHLLSRFRKSFYNTTTFCPTLQGSFQLIGLEDFLPAGRYLAIFFLGWSKRDLSKLSSLLCTTFYLSVDVKCHCKDCYEAIYPREMGGDRAGRKEIEPR